MKVAMRKLSYQFLNFRKMSWISLQICYLACVPCTQIVNILT
jgi:hypothetical protein